MNRRLLLLPLFTAGLFIACGGSSDLGTEDPGGNAGTNSGSNDSGTKPGTSGDDDDNSSEEVDATVGSSADGAVSIADSSVVGDSSAVSDSSVTGDSGIKSDSGTGDSGMSVTDSGSNPNDCPAVNPCQNGGTCVDGIGTYTCSCATGYSGPTCATNVDDCPAVNPCQNGGTCVDGVNTYSCSCPMGFTGPTCATNTDDCPAVNPCQNGGTCVDGVNNYTCSCATGYSGPTCGTNIDDCPAVNPCQNGGTCVDGVNAYTCSCAMGFTGATCATNIDDCPAVNPCNNGGSCVDGVNAYSCSCANGYTGATCDTYPTSCKAIRLANAALTSGQYMIDPDGAGGVAPFNAYCDMTTDGGGWTIVAAYTGATGEKELTSDTESTGNPLTFNHYNTNRAKKMALAAISTESLFLRNNSKFIKLNAPFVDSSLNTLNTHVHKSATLTSSNGTTISVFYGYSNYLNSGGGDFGISMNPDGVTSGGYTSVNGFDHHNNASYYHLNWGCTRHYLYSYGTGGAGYDVNTAVGDWAVTSSCHSGQGGTLVFYAAMR